MTDANRPTDERYIVISGGDGYCTHAAASVADMERLFLEAHFGHVDMQALDDEQRELLAWIRDDDHWTLYGRADRLHCRIDHEDGWVAVYRVTERTPEPCGEQRRVYLIATGIVHEGEETYTRHDDRPPPLCDAECLFTSPQAKSSYEGLQAQAIPGAGSASGEATPGGGPFGWSRADLEELRERLVSSHISAFIDGTGAARTAKADRKFIKTACVDAANLIDELLRSREPAENDLYRQLVVRGYAQHEADYIANGPYPVDHLARFALGVLTNCSDASPETHPHTYKTALEYADAWRSTTKSGGAP